MKIDDNVDILLATFNGERYVAQQIESILAQTFDRWKLIIRDDCSTDDTTKIINDYSAKYPEKIVVLDNNSENIGPCQNFARLLECSTADYIMFCDQDDVWFPHKITVTLNKFRALEAAFGKQASLMVYTDLKVGNEHLDIISDSFWQLMRLKPQNGNKLNRLVLQNVPTACTMMINKPLRDKATPIPTEAIMHDHWLTLVVTAFGRSDFLPEPTILYRQHSMNVCGTESLNLAKIVKELCNSKTRKEVSIRRNGVIRKLQKQVEAFLDRYQNSLSLKNQRMLKSFSRYNQNGFFMRRYYILKHGFLYGSLRHNIGMFLFR